MGIKIAVNTQSGHAIVSRDFSRSMCSRLRLREVWAGTSFKLEVDVLFNSAPCGVGPEAPKWPEVGNLYKPSAATHATILLNIIELC